MLSLVIFVLTVSNIWLVHGDEPLVKEVCEGTPKPEVCEQCLKDADSGSDKKGLALRSIACSMGTSGIVDGDLENIAKGSDDPDVKDKCARCQKFIGVDAIQSLRNAVSLLKDNDSSEAAKQLTAATDRWLDCSKLVQDLAAAPPFPQDFTWLMNLYVDTQSILYEL